MSVLTEDIDRNPYTGIKYVTGKLRINKEHYLDKFFNGAKNVSQVKNVTRGKEYNIIYLEGYGDMEDVIFINDIGKEQRLGSFFFEEIE